MVAAASNSTTPEARRFSIPLRPAARCYLAAIAMVFALIGLAGVQLHRKQAAIREIERLGGWVSTSRAGPPWLRRLIGNEWMRGFDNVSYIHLRNAQVTEAVVLHSVGLTSLQALRLEGPKVTDDHMAQLKGLTNLRSLRLTFADVTDAGLAHLKGMTRLRHLYLEYTLVTDAGLVHLESLTSLKELCLHGTKVTESGIAELQTALPNVAITTNRKVD
jgi:hypothetical protein